MVKNRIDVYIEIIVHALVVTFAFASGVFTAEFKIRSFDNMVSDKTIYVENDIYHKESIKDLLDYIRQEKDNFLNWQFYITEQLQLRGCSYEKFGKMSGFSKNTIKSWCCNGTMPRSRDMFIKLAFGLKMNIDETNELLVKYGKYSALYAKDLYDAITIYVINQRIDNWDDENYNYESLEKWYKKFEKISGEHRVNPKYYNDPKTIGIFCNIADIRDDLAFEKYILANKDIFFSSYSSLICFIEDFIEIRLSEISDGMDEERYSWHKYITDKGLDSSFEIMLSRLKHNGILPRREQLIALGIHLNMVANDINKMLSLANMRELYARDMAESLIMYLLRNAEIADPDLQFNNAWKYVMTTSDRKIKKEYQNIIERYYGEDYDEEWNDDGIEDLSEYIRNIINDNADDGIGEKLSYLVKRREK